MSFAPIRPALAAALALGLSALPAAAAELIMVEQKGCSHCNAWKDTIGPIYPKSPEGKFAPLRHVNIRDGAPDGVSYARPVNFTPTFILVEDGAEVGRIEGYPGEDFFWGLLDMLLKRTTDYTDSG